MNRDGHSKRTSGGRDYSKGEHMADIDPPAADKFRILIIDDEIDLRAFLMEFCAVNGYEAECAGDGHSALERIEHSRFDLAIVDYLMPGINGIEFVKQAKQLRPDLPVIAMSAWYDLEKAFLEAGAFKFMKKPFDPYRLEEEVAMLAGHGES
ncbi:MAG: response regulator [Nitrospiraceae bacterium]|nr:response regulator [Nitrospiraceae bacterium]